MSTWIGIQCRSDSERLPNKFALTIAGAPMLQMIYETAVATGLPTCVLTPYGDQAVIDFCNEHKMPVFQGPKNDLIKRYKLFAETYGAYNVVRLTADCPFLDIAELSYMINTCSQVRADFGTNCPTTGRTIIDGNDVEWVSYKAMKWLDENAKSDEHREHLLTYAYDNWPDLISDNDWTTVIRQSLYPMKLLANVKTSIDTQEEYDEMSKLFQARGSK